MARTALCLAFLILALPARAQESTVTRSPIVADAEATEAILVDPGFEEAAPDATRGWVLHAFQTRLDESVKRSGRSLRIDSDNAWGDSGADQTVRLDRTAAKPLRLRASCRAQAMPDTPGELCSAVMTVNYADGRPASRVVLAFPQGPHEWMERATVFVPLSPVASIDVFVGLRRTTGTVWFDDVSVDELTVEWDAANFDGEGLLAVGSPPAAAERAPAHRMEAKDGSLALTLGEAGGHVVGLELAHTNYADPGAAATAGFSVREGTSPQLHRVRLPVSSQPSHLKQHGLLPALGIHFTGTVWSKRDRLEIRMAVENRRPEERALTLYFTLPIDARGWTWWDGLRLSRKIDREGEYSTQLWLGTGSTGRVSALPVAAMTGAAGLAAGIPPERAQQARLGYNVETREFFVAFDVALTPKGGKPPNQAEFVFWIAGTPPAAGLREAVARWHADSPAAFATRKVPEGAVLMRAPIAEVPSARDFAIAYNLVPSFVAVDDCTADDRAGVLTLLGIDPMYASITHRPPPQNYGEMLAALDAAVKLADAGNLNDVQRAANQTLRETARMIQACAVQGPGGELHWDYFAGFASLRLTVNPDPDLRAPSGTPNKAEHAFRTKDLAPLWSGGKRGTLDGAWVAAVETGADRLEYRPAALAACDGPLTFETATRRPCLPLAWAHVEFFTRCAGELRKRKKVLLAHNGPLWCTALAVPFDAFYYDVALGPRDDLGSAAWDAIFLHRAALAGDRPVTMMFSGDFNQVKAPFVRAFLAQCAAYGFYPGWLDHRGGGGRNEPVFRTAAWWDAVRDDTRRTLELVRELRAAGWRPATGAAFEPETVHVERWGDHKSGTLTFTIHNPTDARVEGTLKLRAAALDLPATGIRVRDRAGGEPLPLGADAAGGTVDVPVAVEPREVRVLTVRRG